MNRRFTTQSELDDLVNRWHEGPSGVVELHEFLGLTASEYALYLEEPRAFWVAFRGDSDGRDERPPDPEPELQHQDNCPYPLTPCQCSRMHLIGETYRLRERVIAAEARLARMLQLKQVDPYATWPIEVVLAENETRARAAAAAGYTVDQEPDTKQWLIDWSTPIPSDDTSTHYAVVVTVVGPLPPKYRNWHHPDMVRLSEAIVAAAHGGAPDGTDPDISAQIVPGHAVGYDVTDVENPTAKQILAALGHYTSTACHHRLHDQCRHSCKFGDEPCQCHCHAVERGGP